MTRQQREAIDGLLRASPFNPAGDLREQRPLFEQMIAAAPVPSDVVTTPGQLGGVPVLWIDIPATTTGGVIVYFHGGFFAIGRDLGRSGRRPGPPGTHARGDCRLPARPEHPTDCAAPTPLRGQIRPAATMIY